MKNSGGGNLCSDELKRENNFSNYIKKLKSYAQKYVVMIVACDTPWGPPFTQELTHSLKEIGLKIDLYGRFRHGYVALIDSGKLVYEKMSSTKQDIVKYKVELDGNSIELMSTSFDMAENDEGLAGDKGIIRINEKDYFIQRRGLDFVVFDKKTCMVVDAVNFDTYEPGFHHYRPSEIVDGIHKFINSNPNVPLIQFKTPEFPSNGNLTENEKFILKYNFRHDTILQNLDKPIFAINRYYDIEAIKEVLSVPKSYHDINGVRRFEDTKGKYVNTVGGHRVTEYQPQNRKRTIYIVGGCTTYGLGAEDKHTIASFLQEIVNDYLPEEAFVIQNYGYFLRELDAQTQEEITILNSLPVKSGDIVLANFSNLLFDEFPYIDMSKIAMNPRDYEVFFDNSHFTPHGNKLIATKLFAGLKEAGAFEKIVTTNDNYGLDENDNNELAEYKKTLIDFYNQNIAITVGAIVMNCNPFTLGHRYLIEKALEQCNYLAIFVVEEDKSIFSFEDRFRLVYEGTLDLQDRVILIPSGRFIISSRTFSEYFNKSELQERTIDTSMDVTIFAKEIAPCLHITKRFAGEEPFDKVTRQYNESMKQILPEYGIEFIEIPRKEMGNEVISASRVRMFLENREFDEIKKIVPETTLKYLMEKYD